MLGKVNERQTVFAITLAGIGTKIGKNITAIP
jgi:hypothetical protein